MAALIPDNALGVNAWAFCVHFSEELSQNCTQVLWTYCFEIHCNFSFLVPVIELFYSPLSWRGTWGAPEHRNTAKKINDHRKKSQRNTVTATRIFRAMNRSSTLKIILSHTSKNFIQNKHITTLSAAHVSILQMPVTVFLFL